MSYVHRTMLVPASLVGTVRELAKMFPSTDKMWTIPVGKEGKTTHYISAGPVGVDLVGLMEDPQLLSSITNIPLTQAEALLSQCIVVDAPWEQVLEEQQLTVMERQDG